MKKIGQSVLAGIAVALGGIAVSDLAANLFNGLGGYGFSCVFGICLYLCVVVVTCTGLILAELRKRAPGKADNDRAQ